MGTTDQVAQRRSAIVEERIAGIVDRVTFHSPDTGWSVLKVDLFSPPGSKMTVLVHQARVYAGATMEFVGGRTVHPKYGEQFRATQALERKPASAAALERYLASGLIKGVGPKTARRIVAHFGERTLSVFEDDIQALKEVRGIAGRKLEQIAQAWEEHRAIRHVMMFLQEHGVSTLFAVKIYKLYGDGAIDVVRENPYRLARDVYGIGFFSADRIALSLGFERDGPERVRAGIRHVLAASREHGHCFLLYEQIHAQVCELLDLAADVVEQHASEQLSDLVGRDEVCVRHMPVSVLSQLGLSSAAQLAAVEKGRETAECYYARTLYRDERIVAEWVRSRAALQQKVDRDRCADWLKRYSEKQGFYLSASQHEAVLGIVGQMFSILTGGPGCGKTTTTRSLVHLLRAMGLQVALAAPTGRAAQRMSEVIGLEAKTIHRLLEWDPKKNGFKRCAESTLLTDFLVVDETSMLDVSLGAALVAAIPKSAQVLFIGDPDQLPAVGAGDVLRDLLRTQSVCRFALTEVFRQAGESSIIRNAHAIQQGKVPAIPSPLAQKRAWEEGSQDSFFFDAENATQEQLRFIRRVRNAGPELLSTTEDSPQSNESQGSEDETADGALVEGGEGQDAEPSDGGFVIPDKFKHVDLRQVLASKTHVEELASVLKTLPRHSTLRFGMDATDVIRRLYTKSLPNRLGERTEIQILVPMNRGTLGAAQLNTTIQDAVNPVRTGVPYLQVGERSIRVGDRVIQRRNNYDAGVFNGDIGVVDSVDTQDVTCTVRFTIKDGDNFVTYRREDLGELGLAYAITIHKSQGSEFDVVIIPLALQHHKMLFRNLLYTGLTRAKKLAVFVGSRGALALCVNNIDTSTRQTALTALVDDERGR